MEHRDLVAEGVVELRGGRGRKADLRHQQDGRAIEIERPLHRCHIHRRLARAGDAVEQVRAKSAICQLPRYGVKCLLLLRIQCEGLGAQTAQVEGQRPIFHANEFAAHQCAQGGRRYRQCAQHRNRQRAAGSGERRENRLLVLIQLRQTLHVHQHRVAFQPARVAGRGYGFARDPLLAHHAVDQLAARAGGAHQRGPFCGLAAQQDS